MKVSREQDTFKPVTITLESYEEVALIKSLLGGLTDKTAERILGKPFRVYPVYSELHNVTREIPNNTEFETVIEPM